MKRIAAAFSLIAIGTGLALANPAEDREALMKTFGKSMGELGAVAKGEKPFDAAAVLASLNAFNENARKLDVKALFPEGDTGDAASPKIWENFADFEARAVTFKTDLAAATANPPQDVSALQASMGMIGKSCGGCHEIYRVKK